MVNFATNKSQPMPPNSSLSAVKARNHKAQLENVLREVGAICQEADQVASRARDAEALLIGTLRDVSGLSGFEDLVPSQSRGQASASVTVESVPTERNTSWTGCCQQPTEAAKEQPFATISLVQAVSDNPHADAGAATYQANSTNRNDDKSDSYLHDELIKDDDWKGTTGAAIPQPSSEQPPTTVPQRESGTSVRIVEHTDIGDDSEPESSPRDPDKAYLKDRTPSGSIRESLAAVKAQEVEAEESHVLIDQILVSCMQAPHTFVIAPWKIPASISSARTSFANNRESSIPEIEWRKVNKRGRAFILPALHPDSNVVLLWMLVGLIFTFYELLVIPYRLAFQACPEGGYAYFEFVVNLFFMVDIGMNFLVGYFDTTRELPKLILEHRLIAKRYVRSWFFIDVLASIPFDWIECGDSRVIMLLRGFRVMRFMRIIRLLRLAKLKPLFDRWEMILENGPFLLVIWSLAKVVLLLFTLAHVAACIWYSVGVNYKHFWPEDPETGVPRSWIDTHIPTIIQGSKFQSYFYSVYFTLVTMTTVGYGDVTPTNIVEVVFTLLLLGCSSVIFAGMLGVVNFTFTSLYNESQQRRNSMARLAKYMRWRAMPLRLRKNLRHFLLFVWEQNEEHEKYEEVLMQRLSPAVRGEVCFHVYGTVLRTAPFLAWMSDFPVCLRHLATLVASRFYDAADLLFRDGQANHTLFFLVRGKLAIGLTENLFKKERVIPKPMIYKSENPDSEVLICDVARRPLPGRTRRMDAGKAPHLSALLKDRVWETAMNEVKECEREEDEEAQTVYADLPGVSVVEGDDMSTFKRKTFFGNKKASQASDAGAQGSSKSKNQPPASSASQNPEPGASAMSVSLSLGVGTTYLQKMHESQEQAEERVGFYRETLRSPWDYLPGKTFFAEAPAFFGESALYWEEGEPPPRHNYSAWCLSRAECVCCEKADIYVVIEEHPFLRPRFLRWRAVVRHERKQWLTTMRDDLADEEERESRRGTTRSQSKKAQPGKKKAQFADRQSEYSVQRSTKRSHESHSSREDMDKSEDSKKGQKVLKFRVSDDSSQPLKPPDEKAQPESAEQEPTVRDRSQL